MPICTHWSTNKFSEAYIDDDRPADIFDMVTGIT